MGQIIQNGPYKMARNEKISQDESFLFITLTFMN